METYLETSADNGSSPKPDPMQFFTFLYGLFPCNTIRFLRAPIDYLRKAQYDSPFEGDWEEMIDEIAIQTRSANVLRRHALHPALVSLNAEKEVQDKQRWMRQEPADITAECIGLYLGGWHDQAPATMAFTPRGSVDVTNDPMMPASSLLLQGAVGAGGYRGRDLDHSLSMAGTLEEEDDFRGRLGGIPPLDLEQQHGTQHLASANPLLSERRGSSPAVSVTSSSPVIHPLHSVATRTAVNADDILSTYASLKRGDPVAPSQRQAWPQPQSMSLPRPLNRSATWVHSVPEYDPSSVTATPRSGSTSRMGPPTSGAMPLRFPLGPSAPSAAAVSHAHSSVDVSAPASPLSQEASLHRSRSRTTSTSAPGHRQTEREQGRASRNASPSRGSDINAMHRHALTASLSAHTRSNDSPTRSARAEVYSAMNALQRENLLLRNELNFELYLKEQHLRHIGRLHRDRVSDTALEAERQNLYYSVRSLRAQLATITAGAEKQRSEAGTIKARHLTWENEQNARLKSFREERKIWVAEMQNLKAQLEEVTARNQAKDAQMDEALNARFEAEAKLAIAEPKLKKIDEYDTKVKQLSTAMVHWESDVQKYEEQRREMQVLLGRWHEMELMLQSMGHQVQTSEKREQESELQMEQLRRQVEQLEMRAAREKSAALSPPLPSPPPGATTSNGDAALDAPLALDQDKATRQYAERCAALEAEAMRLRAELGEARAMQEYVRARQATAAQDAAAAASAAGPPLTAIATANVEAASVEGAAGELGVTAGLVAGVSADEEQEEKEALGDKTEEQDGEREDNDDVEHLKLSS